MKKQLRKLVLYRETLRNLNDTVLDGAVGASTEICNSRVVTWCTDPIGPKPINDL